MRGYAAAISTDAGYTEILDASTAGVGNKPATIHLCLSVYASVNNATLSFVKTYNGDHEIDFIIEKDSKVIACEVKLSPSVDDGDLKHLRWFREKVGNDCCDAMIITTGGAAYRREDGIAVVPAALLGA